MAFAAHIDTPKRRGGRHTLLVDDHLADMPATEAVDARTLLGSRQSDAQIAEAFTAEGYPVSTGAVRAWRIRNVDTA